MRKIMYNLGENVPLEQVDNMLMHFDENGDGQVDPDEFDNALLDEKRLGTKALQAS